MVCVAALRRPHLGGEAGDDRLGRDAVVHEDLARGRRDEAPETKRGRRHGVDPRRASETTGASGEKTSRSATVEPRAAEGIARSGGLTRVQLGRDRAGSPGGEARDDRGRQRRTTARGRGRKTERGRGENGGVWVWVWAGAAEKPGKGRGCVTKAREKCCAAATGIKVPNSCDGRVFQKGVCDLERSASIYVFFERTTRDGVVRQKKVRKYKKCKKNARKRGTDTRFTCEEL